MLCHADGFIAPCLWGIKEKKSAYLLYNENNEDILIQSHHLPADVVARGGRMRLFGEISSSRGVKEMAVVKYILLDS